ncbi:MAG: FeoA domain-containing protein [Thermodesulfobacteriota bacterium]|nr:FeoA domain-containing protein [Thermodesulfobacteriota bacterium]
MSTVKKQLCTLGTGEKGKITLILTGEHLAEKFDRHWIKEGAEVQALHRLEAHGHPLMIMVNGVHYHIPQGLTKKIYMDVI